MYFSFWCKNSSMHATLCFKTEFNLSLRQVQSEYLGSVSEKSETPRMYFASTCTKHREPNWFTSQFCQEFENSRNKEKYCFPRRLYIINSRYFFYINIYSDALLFQVIPIDMKNFTNLNLRARSYQKYPTHHWWTINGSHLNKN